VIPENIRMRNFMPYRGEIPAFSFKGIHTACICGDNGNGKSALIDAITWSLWGKSRAKSDDDLITLGEKDMEVEFEFYIGEQLYRIIRKHSSPKSSKVSGQSSLDLFIASNGGFNTITSDTKSQTQQNIISLLNMDYDTFVNSAFLRQGHADEFTKQSPAKRKEVLSNILGLSLYDQLEARAKDQYRYRQIEKTQLENIVQEIDQGLVYKPELEAEFNCLQDDLIQSEAEVKGQQSVLNHLRQQKESLESKNQQMAQLNEHLEKTKDYLERWNRQMEQRQKNINEYRELIALRVSIEAGYNKYIQTKSMNNEMNRKLQQLSKVKDRINRLEQVVQKAQSEMLSKHAVVQSRINQLETNVNKLSLLREERSNLKNKQQFLTQLEGELQDKRQHEKKLRNILHELEFTYKRIEHEIRNIEENLVLLSTQDNAKCPLCETVISKDGLDNIKAKHNSEKDKKIATLYLKKTEYAKKSTMLSEIESDVKNLENRLIRDSASIQGKVGVIDKSLEEAEYAAKQLDEEKYLLSEIESSLLNKDFAVQEQATLIDLEKELASYEYEPDKHQQVSEDLTTLEKYQQSKQRLDEGKRMLKLELKELENTIEAAQELSHRLEIDTQKKQSLVSDLKALPQLEIDLKQAEIKYQLVSEKQRRSQEVIGSLKGKLEHIASQEIKRQEKKKQFEQAVKEASVYLDLSHAFGKKGIQAMLIELALPDIEIEANKLLSRMTDNRMHLKIETRRQSKKGEPIETLDIVISDELGPRPYENYSGGEVFRIDFALRIALSRLLAKRAGAPLPTLIIDEGFGTQDNIGLEKIKETINSIQDDFDKILVITHIDELKDAFPTRINVIKTATGSTIEAS
jgi:exonuclease SbcC